MPCSVLGPSYFALWTYLPGEYQSTSFLCSCRHASHSPVVVNFLLRLSEIRSDPLERIPLPGRYHDRQSCAFSVWFFSILTLLVLSVLSVPHLQYFVLRISRLPLWLVSEMTLMLYFALFALFNTGWSVSSLPSLWMNVIAFTPTWVYGAGLVPLHEVYSQYW